MREICELQVHACSIHFKRVQDFSVRGSSSTVVQNFRSVTLNKGGFAIKYLEFGGKFRNVV